MFVQVDTGRHYIELFSYTAECNWLDVVEIHLRDGDGPGECGGGFVVSVNKCVLLYAHYKCTIAFVTAI